MVNVEFSRLLSQFIKERRITQRTLIGNLKSQGYSYTDAAVSKWVSGKRTPPADVVEAIEDILESPKGWLLKAAGYPADAQIRQLSVIEPEKTRHFQEISVALFAIASNLENYLDQIEFDSSSTIGDVVYGGWLNLIDGTVDALSVKMRDINKPLALSLLLHLKEEFPELDNINDWDQLTDDKINHDFIARLKIKASRGDFTGTCDLCPLDD
jgi:hypothetical protein